MNHCNQNVQYPKLKVYDKIQMFKSNYDWDI